MNQKTFRLAFAMLAAVIAFAPFATQAQDDVTVESILKMHIKSIGDVETLKAVKTMRTVSTISAPTPVGDMEIEMSRIQAGKKFVMTQDIPQMGEVTNGSDGEVYWTINPFQGAKVFEGDELEMMKSQAPGFFPELEWLDGYDGEITMDGTEEVDGKMSYKLVFAPTDGPVETRFFEKETGRVLKTVSTREIPGAGEMTTEITSSDFKTVDGITMAHTQVISTPQGDATMTIDTMEVNPELAEDAFVLPEDIQSLIDD